MDEYTIERYPHGIPESERPGYHTQKALAKHAALLRVIREFEARTRVVGGPRQASPTARRAA